MSSALAIIEMNEMRGILIYTVTQVEGGLDTYTIVNRLGILD